MPRPVPDDTGGGPPKGGPAPDRQRDAAAAVAQGVSLYAEGDLLGAERELRRALKLWPEQRRARTYLGWVLRELRAREGGGQVAEVMDRVTDKLRSQADASEPEPSVRTPRERSSEDSMKAALREVAGFEQEPAGQAPPSLDDSLFIDLLDDAPRRSSAGIEPPGAKEPPGGRNGVEMGLEAPAPSRDTGPEIEEIDLDTSGDPGDDLLDLIEQAGRVVDADDAPVVAFETEGSAPFLPALEPEIPAQQGHGAADEAQQAGQVAPAAARPRSGLSDLLSDVPVLVPQEDEGARPALRTAPPADTRPPIRPAASGLSSLLSDTPVPVLSRPSGLSDLLSAAPPAAPPAPAQKPSGLSDLPIAEPPEPPSGISALLSGEPDAAPVADLSLLDIPLDAAHAADASADEGPPGGPALDGPYVPGEAEFELISEPQPPPPAARSPLLDMDLFADVVQAHDEPSRPLVISQKAAEGEPEDAGDFVVDFDDLEPAEPQRPGTFPPPPPRHSDQDQTLRDALRILQQGDRETAFAMAEKIHAALSKEPGAQQLKVSLAELYEAQLAPLERIPKSGPLPRDLDPQSAFLLSLLDGSMTLEEALTISGMERLRGARTMVLLMRRGLIKV